MTRGDRVQLVWGPTVNAETGEVSPPWPTWFGTVRFVRGTQACVRFDDPIGTQNVPVRELTMIEPT